jgi:hypothetical protein
VSALFEGVAFTLFDGLSGRSTEVRDCFLRHPAPDVIEDAVVLAAVKDKSFGLPGEEPSLTAAMDK